MSESTLNETFLNGAINLDSATGLIMIDPDLLADKLGLTADTAKINQTDYAIGLLLAYLAKHFPSEYDTASFNSITVNRADETTSVNIDSNNNLTTYISDGFSFSFWKLKPALADFDPANYITP